MREAGFTLVEIVIAIAIVAATVAAGFGISLGSRSLAVSTAAGEFDQFLDSARTIALDLDGATLAFTPDAYGDGTEIRVLAGGPNRPPERTTLPVLHARATIEEAEVLGKAPFAFIVHANGSLSGRPGYHVGDTATNDVGCPASGAFHFVIKAAGGSADRYVPCRTTLATGGPVTLTSWPPAPIAPSPTPCSGVGCTATALPTAPASTASCPPSFTEVAGGCVPVLSSGSSSGPRYHVTITGAPAAISVGAAGSFTAQATLANANAAPVGTPASIPVGIQSADATCAAAPSGWQPSGSSFTVTSAAPGACTVTMQGDVSGIPGATTDTATVSVTIATTPNAAPTPAPSQCDLFSNGKCYHRIVDRTNQMFTKTVSPGSTCEDAQPTAPCVYLDSIRFITLDGYTLKPPAAPTDAAHELLFRIDSIDGLSYDCIPYSAFANIVPENPLPLFGRGIGAPPNPPIGFGKPSVYVAIEHVFLAGIPDSFDEKTESQSVLPTLSDMIDALARSQSGPAYSFTYFSGAAPPGSTITWLPDFPGCDNAGDSASAGVEYGNVTVLLSFEVFQAME
jgi:prepilin-type N-terminal cleavage/methylation domain-containing protein